MKRIVGLATGIVLLSTVGALSDAQNESAPLTHTFTATMHYVYNSRQYQPTVPIVYALHAPMKTATSEEALMSQLSALHKSDYEWWMATWDTESQKKWELRRKQSGQEAGIWLKALQEEYAAGSCALKTWILRRQYVILRYTCTSKSTNLDALSRDHAVAFKIDDGEFVATLDLEKDPIFRYANGADVELQIKPRN